MADTTTVSTDVRYALCACCPDHGDDLTSPPVVCPRCGQPCSCRGCIAENDEPKENGDA
jgi:hypothetical protein